MRGLGGVKWLWLDGKGFDGIAGVMRVCVWGGALSSKPFE
jgi:hypothetical protein